MRGRPNLYTDYQKESSIFSNNTQKSWFGILVTLSVAFSTDFTLVSFSATVTENSSTEVLLFTSLIEKLFFARLIRTFSVFTCTFSKALFVNAVLLIVSGL